MNRRPRVVLAALLASASLLAACGSSDETPAAAGSSGSGLSGTVGFIFVVPKTDLGYNQAAYEASQKVAKALGVKVLTQENVPEDDNAARVMESMISRGAKLI